MTTPFAFPDARALLEHEFAQRRRRNTRYSLRAFARDAGLSPAYLSEILAGKRAPSEEMASDMGKRLKLDEAGIAHLRALARLDRAVDPAHRDACREECARIARQRDVALIDDDAFDLIAEWHHLAFCSHIARKDADTSLDGLVQAFGLPRDVCEDALSRLERLGFVERAGAVWKATKPRTAHRPTKGSEAVRSFHAQILSKAREALEGRPPAERYFESRILNFRAGDLPTIGERIREFSRALAEEFAEGEGSEDTACLAIQFFPVTTRREAWEPSEQQRTD